MTIGICSVISVVSMTTRDRPMCSVVAGLLACVINNIIRSIFSK